MGEPDYVLTHTVRLRRGTEAEAVAEWHATLLGRDDLIEAIGDPVVTVLPDGAIEAVGFYRAV